MELYIKQTKQNKNKEINGSLPWKTKKAFVLICFCPFFIYFAIIELPSVRKRHLCLSQGKMSACFKKCCSSGRHPISEAELQNEQSKDNNLSGHLDTKPAVL